MFYVVLILLFSLVHIPVSPALFPPLSLSLFYRAPPNRLVQMRAALSLYPSIKRIVYDKSSGSSLTKRPLARWKTRAGVYMRGMNKYRSTVL